MGGSARADAGGGGGGGGGGCGRGMCPLPHEARKLLGVPYLVTQTIHIAPISYSCRIPSPPPFKIPVSDPVPGNTETSMDTLLLGYDIQTCFPLHKQFLQDWSTNLHCQKTV